MAPPHPIDHPAVLRDHQVEVRFGTNITEAELQHGDIGLGATTFVEQLAKPVDLGFGIEAPGDLAVGEEGSNSIFALFERDDTKPGQPNFRQQVPDAGYDLVSQFVVDKKNHPARQGIPVLPSDISDPGQGDFDRLGVDPKDGYLYQSGDKEQADEQESEHVAEAPLQGGYLAEQHGLGPPSDLPPAEYRITHCSATSRPVLKRSNGVGGILTSRRVIPASGKIRLVCAGKRHPEGGAPSLRLAPVSVGLREDRARRRGSGARRKDMTCATLTKARRLMASDNVPANTLPVDDAKGTILRGPKPLASRLHALRAQGMLYLGLLGKEDI